jgi:3-oxoacyl-[acyl-carrier-protein] synthase II
MANRSRIVVTGRGVMSAIGTSVAEFDANLAGAVGGISRHDSLVPGMTAYVGLVEPFVPHPRLPAGCDRTAELATSAVAEALTEAGIWNGTALSLPGERVALLLGSSHGGRSQIDRFVTAGSDASDPALAHGVMERGAHYQQTAVVASVFGVHGPVATLSTACSSSGTAITHAIDLLQTGQAAVVIAGGADAFSLLTFAGFRALGAVADEACGPFGSRTGISLGEGAAFVVLERLDAALARGATPLAELFGSATTWDAHHLTAPEPSGDGMRRAIESALAISGLSAGAIDYVNAHGTGTRSNDIAETLAIKRVFSAPPPVSATKSFTGHTLGASSAAGLLAGIAGMRAQKLPPTLNFGTARPGCDLDYVPHEAREASVDAFVALSAAFGGCNCAIVAGQVRAGDEAAAPAPEHDAIVVTGIGVISPLGCDPGAAFDAAFEEASWGEAETANVRGFDPKRHLPRGRSSRMNQITQFAVASAEQALAQAGWTPERRRPTAIGLMVGLSRGAVASFQACMESVGGGAWAKASPSSFPHLVMSSVGGQVSVAVGLRGPASTLVGEGEVGIALLGHAAALLAQRPELDALVVVTADELTPVFLQMQSAAFGRSALPLAEGAVTLVLERQRSAQARGASPLAEISGWAQSFEGGDAEGVWLERAIRAALARAGEAPERVGVALTLARGETGHDRREAAALRRVFGNTVPPIGAVSPHAGWAEASAGLLAVAMAVLSLQQGRVPRPAGRLGMPWLQDRADGEFETALVAGSSRYGSNAAVLLRQPQLEAA